MFAWTYTAPPTARECLTKIDDLHADIQTALATTKRIQKKKRITINDEINIDHLDGEIDHTYADLIPLQVERLIQADDWTPEQRAALLFTQAIANPQAVISLATDYLNTRDRAYGYTLT